MHSSPPALSFREALAFWWRLGCISFGGPAGQIALMQRALVEEKRWISQARFLHALNYCMLLPGPEAQQLATYIGWLLHRTWGGIAAGVLFVLPSFFVLLALGWGVLVYGSVPWVAGALFGIQAAVAALVLQALSRMAGKTLGNPRKVPVLWALAAMSFVAIAVLHIAFPWIVLAAAALGWLAARRWPQQFVGGGHAAANRAAHPPCLIDDDTPTPEHARFAPRRLARVLAWGLWLLPMAALYAYFGAQGTLTQMGWFFTKAALLTFGGAYAVLPYVVQGAVQQFAWLSPAQMMHGLALGESTPGPLIMVVAYVGFIGGWTQQVLGPSHLFWGASLAALVVTWFTFLPSFIFILAGGPLVESTHGQLHFTAPLRAISAAVVGVVAQLALFFIANVAHWTWATGEFVPKIDVFGVLLMLLAAWALLRQRWGVLPVLLASAVLGVALQQAGLA